LIWNETVLGWLAIFANVDWSTLDTVIVTSGLINGAGLISDFIVVHEIIGRDSFTTMATIIVHGAGDNNLRRNVDIWPLSFSSDFNSIRH
jgi:hypothetical protein